MLSFRLINLLKQTLYEFEEDINENNIKEFGVLFSLNLSTENVEVQEEALDNFRNYIDVRMLYNWTNHYNILRKILDTNYPCLSPRGIFDKEKKKIYDEACRW